MSSLSRIIALAQKTGAPVVLYDCVSDTDFVFMQGDLYRSLNTEAEEPIPFFGRDHVWFDGDEEDDIFQEEQDTHVPEDMVLDHWYAQERRALIEDMSSIELLDHINRDIAVWRAKEEQYQREQVADSLEHELVESPYSEDVVPTEEWHTPADILRSYDMQTEHMPYTPSGYTSPEVFTGMRPQDSPVALEWDAVDDVRGEWSPLYPLETVSSQQREPIRIEEEPFDPPLYDMFGEQEPLPDTDAPVFYNEPVV